MAGILLVNDSTAQCQQVHQAISALPDDAIVNEARTAQECLLLLGSTTAQVAMVRCQLPDADGLQLVAQIQARKPHIQVILTLDGNEPVDVWQRILQMGLRNVITPPLDYESIRRAIQQAMQAPMAVAGAPVGGGEECFVVAVAAARGGVGKTLVATNLAASMAQWSSRVCLADFSGQPNDFSVMLDDVPRNTLADLLTAGDTIDAEFLETILAAHPSLGFRYLSSPQQEFNAAEFTKPLARDVVRNLRQLAEFVVIDTGEPEAPATQAAVMECGLAFVVTTRDVARLLATQRFIKRLAEWEVDADRVKVLVNSAEIGAEISDGEIESILECPVAAYLPSNPGPATFSINSGKPLVIHDPKQPLSVVLTKLAELTCRRWSEEHGQDSGPVERAMETASRSRGATGRVAQAGYR